MDSEQARLCERLQSVCELSTPEEIDEFVEIVQELAQTPQDEEVLRCMLRCLRDADAGEAQYELVEACEAYPEPDYVAALLEEGVVLIDLAPQWFELMLMSALNHPSTREEVVCAFRALDDVAAAKHIAFLRGICRESPKYEAVLARLMNARGI